MKIIAAFLVLALTISGAWALPPNDYADAANWLSRPGSMDACTTADLTTAVISADGTITRESFKPNPEAKVDCFYVYPTISKDPAGNSSMIVAPEDRIVVQHQVARLASVCRVFAPKYRQVTVQALRTRFSGKPNPGDAELAYGDVKDAWNSYLARDNHGHGVVLVGHSQGSGMLKRLIQEEIDEKPQQKLLVSAMLMGVNLAVPEGADVGGDFKSVPLCHAVAQTGCVVAFASFRAEAPPPPNTFYGRAGQLSIFPGDTPTPGTAAACVNPAAPGGGVAALKSYLSANSVSIAASLPPAPHWVTPPIQLRTAFVRLPGLVRGQCITDAAGSYLAISLAPKPGDMRTSDIAGDFISSGKIQPQWGLHLVDVNLVMGNLVDLINTQGQAWRRAHRE